MSLTSNLKDTHSRVRRFMEEEFPEARSFIQFAGTKVKDADTLRPTGKVPYGTIGTAFDYRLRYYFGVTPREELVAHGGAMRLAGATRAYDLGSGEKTWQFSGASPEEPVLPVGVVTGFFDSLDDLLAETDSVGRRLDRSQEEALARHCIVLALFEEIVRAGSRIRSPLLASEYVSFTDLLAIAEPRWVEDLCNISLLFHERFSNLLSLPATLNPTFEGSRDVGGADADIIVDSCLIDIKTTVNPRIEPLWLYQVMGYLLLDYRDEHAIDAVGLYLARQGVLIRVPLSDFVSALRGNPAPVSELRERFRTALG